MDYRNLDPDGGPGGGRGGIRGIRSGENPGMFPGLYATDKGGTFVRPGAKIFKGRSSKVGHGGVGGYVDLQWFQRGLLGSTYGW